MFMFHAHNLSLLWNYYNQSGGLFAFEIIYVIVCSVCVCVYFDSAAFASRTATVLLLLKAVPHLGSAAIPQLVKGFQRPC